MTAPAPSTGLAGPLELYMTCTENRVEDNYEGGLVLLQGVRHAVPAVAGQLADSRLVLSAVHDEFMRQFPVTRDEKQARYFRITVEEVAVEDLPPDPDAPVELYDAEGRRRNSDGSLMLPIQYRPGASPDAEPTT